MHGKTRGTSVDARDVRSEKEERMTPDQKRKGRSHNPKKRIRMRRCKNCNCKFPRTRYKSGRLEQVRDYMSRDFCGKRCAKLYHHQNVADEGE